MDEGLGIKIPEEQFSTNNGEDRFEGRETNLFFPEINAYNRIKKFFEAETENLLIINLPERRDYIGSRFKRSLSEIFEYLKSSWSSDYQRETINQLEGEENKEKLSQVDQGDYVFFRTFLPGQDQDIPVLVFGKVTKIYEEDGVKKFFFIKNSYFVISPNAIRFIDRDYQINQRTINDIFPNIINSEKIFLIGQIRSKEVDSVEDFFIPYAVHRYLRQEIYPQLDQETKNRLLFYEANNNNIPLAFIFDQIERKVLNYLESLRDENPSKFAKYSLYFDELKERINKRDDEIEKEREKKEKKENFFQFLEAFGFKRAYLYQEFLDYYFEIVEYLLSTNLIDREKGEELRNLFLFFKKDLKENPNDYIFERNLPPDITFQRGKENEAIFTDNVLNFLRPFSSNLSVYDRKKILTSIKRIFSRYFHPDSNLLSHVPKKTREEFFKAGFKLFSEQFIE